jgi:hypothetical protein
MDFPDDMTLGEARDLLRTLVREGHRCPCCTQYAKVYRFAVNGAMARGLIAMYRRGGTEWVHVPDLKLPGGHMLKFRFWGLIEKPSEQVDDGNPRVGTWRLTSKGETWVRNQSFIASHALIYDNRCLGLAGEHVRITDVLGKKFNYRELMAS